MPSVYNKESGNELRQMVSQPAASVREGRQGFDDSLDQKSDDVLITLFQNGEEKAFRILVDRYQEKVRNLIYSIFNNAELVDDLSQEVFIKVYENLRAFRFQSSFYTWLYRIAVNRSRDELRKRKIRKLFSLQSMIEKSDREVEVKLVSEPKNFDNEELITKALQALPENFRAAIILKDIDGLSYEEMATVMQCQIGTVKSRLSRARSMLRRVLKPLLEESI